jgi:hypothetical protein
MATEPIKRKPGRPSKFDPSFYKLARNYCLLGATNETLAQNFDVDIDTLHRWLRDDDAFRNSVKEGREDADAHVAERLYTRATGYSIDEEQILVVAGKPHKITIKKNIPPETTACIFWLCNRRRGQWRRGEPAEQYDAAASAKVIKDMVRGLFAPDATVESPASEQS